MKSLRNEKKERRERIEMRKIYIKVFFSERNEEKEPNAAESGVHYEDR